MPTKKKSKKDDLEFVFEVGPSTFYLNQMKKKIPEELFLLLKKQIEKEIRSIDTHMDKDGWDLDFGFIKDDILNEIVTTHYEFYLMARLCKKGYTLQFKENKLGEKKLMIVKGE
jgi:hypothetical protein